MLESATLLLHLQILIFVCVTVKWKNYMKRLLGKCWTCKKNCQQNINLSYNLNVLKHNFLSKHCIKQTSSSACTGWDKNQTPKSILLFIRLSFSPIIRYVKCINQYPKIKDNTMSLLLIEHWIKRTKHKIE